MRSNLILRQDVVTITLYTPVYDDDDAFVIGNIRWKESRVYLPARSSDYEATFYRTVVYRSYKGMVHKHSIPLI